MNAERGEKKKSTALAWMFFNNELFTDPQFYHGQGKRLHSNES